MKKDAVSVERLTLLLRFDEMERSWGSYDALRNAAVEALPALLAVVEAAREVLDTANDTGWLMADDTGWLMLEELGFLRAAVDEVTG